MAVKVMTGGALSRRLHRQKHRGGNMAEPASIFDVLDEDVEARAIAKARAEIANGGGVPHEVAREWFKKLAQGEVVSPPCK